MLDKIRTLKFFQPHRIRDFLYYRLKSVRFITFYYEYKYKCPVCNSSIRKFLPGGLNYPVLQEKQVIGGGICKNAYCPVCSANDRERLVTKWLQNESDLFKHPTKLLHVAPENGLKRIIEKQKNIDYLTADLFSSCVMVKMDIMNIQYPNDFFDVIICNHVLEHVLDDRKAMSELYRVLKPGGWAILQVPISPLLEKTYEDASITTASERAKYFGQEDHVRLYGKDYRHRLTAAGFRVDIFDWKTKYSRFGGKTNKFGLNSDEMIYVVRK